MFEAFRSHVSMLPFFWDYAHPVNAVTVLIAMVLFVGALKLIAKFANVLLVIALVVLAFHYFVR